MSIPAKDRFIKTNLRKILCPEDEFDNLKNFSYDSKNFLILGKSNKTDLTDLFEKDEKRQGLFQIILCDEEGYLYEALTENNNGQRMIVAMKTLPPPTGKKAKKDNKEEKLEQEVTGDDLSF